MRNRSLFYLKNDRINLGGPGSSKIGKKWQHRYRNKIVILKCKIVCCLVMCSAATRATISNIQNVISCLYTYKMYTTYRMLLNVTIHRYHFMYISKQAK